MSVTSDLEKFYDSEAEKYHQTRQKHWSDSKKILDALKSCEKKNPVIVELGCGGGRGATLLEKKFEKSFSYTGVDISNNLLSLAKKDHPNLSFKNYDMISYLASIPQESVDIILAFASFQHIANDNQRIALLKNCYRALNYDGILIFTNRACSKWFIQTHRKAIIKSGLKSFITLGNTTRRDVMIPWTGKNGTQYRYYHLYSLKELRKYSELSGLKTITLEYLDKKGDTTKNREDANNSFLISTKTIYKS